jgi:hypothetical protein
MKGAENFIEVERFTDTSCGCEAKDVAGSAVTSETYEDNDTHRRRYMSKRLYDLHRSRMRLLQFYQCIFGSLILREW